MQQMRQIREVIALAMLAISAYTDIKEKYIYTMPLVISSAGAAVISLIQLFALPRKDILADNLVLPALFGLSVIAVIYVHRKHIGMGDAYLLAALGMVMGSRSTLYMTALALLGASVMAVFYLAADIFGAGRRKKSIPFAPFVMVGFLLVLINGI